ncbi:MAG: hypothetical protein GY839_01900 [candidate division Zixibacteria bacterium]|nr:hypothetical protein [candidate division Zixibacteria bacterium]
MNLFIIFSFSFLLSLIFHPVAIRISRGFNVLDNPDRDQIHKTPTPVLGGVAICMSMFIVVLVAKFAGIYQWDRIADGLLVGGGLITLVGFIDDRFGMNPTIKLAGQFIAAGMFVAITKASIGLFHPLVEFSVLIFGLVSMMNAFNILDNMDGVTGGMSFAIGMAFLAVMILAGDYNTALLLAALIGAIIGFLKYNMPRAKIFMGDAGAMFLGFIFGAFAIIYLMSNKSYYLFTTPFLILSYPIFDISLVSLSRMREKRSLSVAAPDSSPYRFVRWVFSTRNAYQAVFFINLVMGLFGVATYILKANQISVLLIFMAGLSLSVLGVHLYRNFLYFIERTIFFLIDMLSINIAFYFLYTIKYTWGLFAYEVYIPYSEMIAPAIWISLFWVLVFSVMGIYEIRPNRSFVDYCKALLKIVFTGMLTFVCVVLALEGRIVVSIAPIFLYSAVLLIFNCIIKYLSFLVARWLTNRPSRRPRVALYIKDKKADLGELLKIARRRFRVVGYINTHELNPAGKDLAYLGDENSLGDIIRTKRLEKIILVWPDDNYDNYMPILRSQFFLENEFLFMGRPGAPFDGFKVIKLYRYGLVKLSAELLRTWEWIFKRGMDVMLSIVFLILTSPIFIYQFIKSRLQKIPFLIQVSYYGRDGKNAKCFDFSSRARKYTGSTRFYPGLPSLLSVISGNLTLVGTLPLTNERAAKDIKTIPGFWRRKLIKPGIWGPAHFSDEKNYFEKELKYLQNMSILTDIYWIIIGIIRSIFLPGKKENA